MQSQKGQTTKEGKERKQPERIEQAIGLCFPVTRMQKFLRNEVSGFDRISKKASAGLSAVMEYINDRIFENALELGTSSAKTENFRLKSGLVAKAIQNDESLKEIAQSAHFRGTNDAWKCDWFEHWKEQKKDADRVRARRMRKEKKMMEEEEMMSKTKSKKSEKGNKKGKKKSSENEEE